MSPRTLAISISLPLLACAAFARAEEGWSPGDTDVIFSEIHYHPPDSEETEEFVELHNRGIHWVDLGGWRFTKGIEFSFPPGTSIAPGEYLVVGRNAAALTSVRGVTGVVGDFRGALSDRGEILELSTRTGRVAAWIHYKDGHGPEGGLWPESPDGEGPSLELVAPHPDWQRAWYWAPSRRPGGSPGGPGSRPDAKSAPRAAGAAARRPDLRVNEVRIDESGAFVEILNFGETAAPLQGLRLTRHIHGRGGTALDGTLGRGRFHVVQGAGAKEALGGKCPVVFLLDAKTLEIVDALRFPANLPEGASFGRHPDGDGVASALPAPTPGASNKAPVVPPVVIHEILYHGADPSGSDEFVELHNAGKKAVSLAGWKLGRGVDFEFPAGSTIEAGGYLVVAKDPARLKAAAGTAPVLGPYSARLSNAGDTISLSDALGDTVDRVRYGDSAPWPESADGGGVSLELLHPGLDNSFAQAWTIGRPGGSPGKQNHRLVKTMPPAIGGVRHEPAVPGPGDQVAIHAHVLDTGSVSQVAAVFRIVGASGPPRKVALSDSGQKDDGAARDGHFAGKLPKLPVGALVAYHVTARDASGRTARSPEAEPDEHVFQVEATPPGASDGPGMPVYRVAMLPEGWQAFQRSPKNQDRWFRCTFVPSIEGSGVNRRKGRVFYGAEIRFRGASSRNPPDGRMSYRVRLPGGELHDGRDRFILNAFEPLKQKAGGDLLRLAGLPVSDATVVRLRTPGFDDGRYVDVEVVNGAFLDRALGSSVGDLFRGHRGDPFGADLSIHGDDPAAYAAVYRRVGGGRVGRDADLSRLLDLLRALSAKGAAYAAGVSRTTDPLEWAWYFAANNVLGNTEGGLSTGQADDYFLAERASDRRFVLIPWDQDSAFDKSDLELYPRRLPATDAFLRHPSFARLYHGAVQDLLDGPLSMAGFRDRLRHLRGTFPAEQTLFLEEFVRRRQVFLREGYPLWPQAEVQGSAPPSGVGSRVFVAGSPAGSPAETVVTGRIHPALAEGVRLDDAPAEYDPVTGVWTVRRAGARLAPGPNLAWLAILGAGETVTGVLPVNLETAPSIREVPKAVAGDVTWEGGPWFLAEELTVPEGATLRLGPGTNVICGAGASIVVDGRLEAEGTRLEPVAFRPASAAGPWRGIVLRGGDGAAAGVAHALSFCRFEGGSGGAPDAPIEGPLDGCFVRVEGSSARIEDCLFRGIAGTAVGGSESRVEARRVRVVDSRGGLLADGGSLVVEDLQLARIHGDGLRARNLEPGAGRVAAMASSRTLGAALAVEGGALEVDDALLHSADAGILAAYGAKVKASRVTVAGAGTGVLLDPPVPSPDGAPAASGPRSGVELVRSIVWPTHEAIGAPSASQVSVTDCVLGPSTWTLEGLRAVRTVEAVPRYTAPLVGDFRLEPGSPGQAAGPGGADWGYSGRKR